MKKRNIWIIFGLLILILLILFQVYLFSKSKKDYLAYYDNCEDLQEYYDIQKYESGEFKYMVEFCTNTGGCFNPCGSACPPKQKIYIWEYPSTINKLCIDMCVSQCVCPYGKIYIYDKGGCI